MTDNAEEKAPVILRRGKVRANRADEPRRFILPRPEPTGTQKEAFKASTLAAARRLMLWVWLLLRFQGAAFYDRLRGRSSGERNAVRLRLLLQRVGSTAIKIGQQLSVRVDILPRVYCRELEKLLDSAPPFPTREAIAVIESETGKSLARTFTRLDPEPIGSASMACVYKAELLTGDIVAVKVRRPGVAEQMTADLKALTLISKATDLFGAVKLGPIVAEISRMLSDELNFKLEAQHMGHFYEAMKGGKKVCVPRTYYHLCTRKLLVAEFIEGVSMKDILELVDSGNPSRWNQLEAEGYNPVKLSRRLARFFYWELFDSVFFHADPHPGNIIIQPGNRIYLLDFGSCGSLPNKLRHALLDFNLAISKRDIEGATRCLLSMNEPLPPLDIEAYSAEMRSMMLKTFLEITNKKAHWKERTVSVAFSESIEIARRYKIPLNPHLLRYFRMVFLSDTILFRLDPHFNHQREVIRWFAIRRNTLRKAAGKKLRSQWPPRFDPLHFEEFMERQRQCLANAKSKLEEVEYAFKAGISKSSYAVTVVISTIGRCVLVAGIAFVGRALYQLGQNPSSNPAFTEDLHWTFGNRIIELIFALLAAFGLYKILARSREIDVETDS